VPDLVPACARPPGAALVDVSTSGGPGRLGRALEGVASARSTSAGASSACACARRGSPDAGWRPRACDRPGQAFGTGAHHTTRLCLELLLGLEPAGALADWGCGTGVLAIAAARLGFAPVLACDNDPARSRPRAENAAANGVDRADVRAATCARARAVGAHRVREPRAAAAARRRRAHDAPARR
jgi:hypothetical protein